MLLFVIIFFVGGGYLLGKIIASFIPSEPKDTNTFITHTHETHNHLHIDKETLQSLIDKSYNSHQNQ